jgi:hypothetical protein
MAPWVLGHSRLLFLLIRARLEAYTTTIYPAARQPP